MHNAIQISTLNDFLFCPYSLYLHSIFSSRTASQYCDIPQTRGTLAHESLEEGGYSTRANVITGKSVYSDEFGIIGKIDIYDERNFQLIERKYRLKRIYDGHKLQLWAEYVCMIEMGYAVNKLTIRSLKDNRSYDITLPDSADLMMLKGIISKMRHYLPDGRPDGITPAKCANCIYASLCTVGYAKPS